MVKSWLLRSQHFYGIVEIFFFLVTIKRKSTRVRNFQVSLMIDEEKFHIIARREQNGLGELLFIWKMLQNSDIQEGNKKSH